MVMRFDKEWAHRSAVDDGTEGEDYVTKDGTHTLRYGPLLRQLGWTHDFLWVLDLQTGEGIFCRPGGSAKADLEKHKVWVCPMYEPFLTWLYRQDLTDLDSLPVLVTLTEAEAPSSMFGYRRSGS